MTIKHLILVGSTLLAVGLFVGWKLNRRVRLIRVILPILILGVVAYFVLGKNETNQQASAFFRQLETGDNLSDGEAEAFRQMARAAPGVRRRVLEIAFASRTNAAIALPRLGFLLQACVGLDSTNDTRQEFWRRVVQPSLKTRPSLDTVRLAAATADFLQVGAREGQEVARLMLPMLSAETNAAMRSALANELGPLADRIQQSDAGVLADSILRQAAQANDLAEFGSLLTNFVQALKRADKAAAQQTLARALVLAESETNSGKALTIARGLAGLQEQMSADDCRRTAELLAAGWLESDGSPRTDVAALLPALAGRMAPEGKQELVLRLVSLLDLHRVSLFYLKWVDALSPVLKECARGMGSGRNATLVSAWIRKPPEVFGDLLWAGLITPLVSEMETNDLQMLAEELMKRILGSNTRVMGFYSARFASLSERFDANQAQRWIDVLTPRLLDPDDGAEWEPLSTCLSHLSPRLDSTAANAFAARLLPAMQQPEVVRVLGLAKALAPIASKLDHTNTDAVIDSLLASMGSRKNVYRVNAVAEQLAPFARNTRSELMQPVLNQLVVAMENETNVDSARTLTSGLGALAELLDETQARRAGEGMIRAIETNPLKYFVQGEALEKLSRRIQPEQATRAVGWLLDRGLSRRGPDTFLALKCAPRVAGALTPDLAESFVKDLASRFGHEKDLSVVCLRIRVAASFTNELGPGRLRFLGDRLLQALEGDTNSFALGPVLVATGRAHAQGGSSPRVFIARDESEIDLYALRALCEALSRILPGMSRGDAEVLGGRLALRFSMQGNIRSVPFDQRIAEALQYAPDWSLRRILETPFAVGGLRLNVLRALELKKG